MSKNPPAIFLLGPPRSGTSLLRVMLAGHPRIFAASELHLLDFNNLVERKASFSGKYSLWLEGTLRALMEIKRCDAVEAGRLMARYEDQQLSTRQFYGLLQEWLGGRILADKTPAYGLDLETLRRAETDFDGALYIHLVRHPCAMVRSFDENHLDQVYFTCDHPFSPRQLGELYWTIVNQNVLQFLCEVPAPRQCRVRFEDLVTRPEAIMREVCRTFCLEFHPDMIRPYKDPERKMLEGIHPQSQSMTDSKFQQYQDIDPQVARRDSPAGDDEMLGEVAWELARMFGYEPRMPTRQSSPVPTVHAAATARAVRTAEWRHLRRAQRRNSPDAGRSNE